MRWLAKLGKQFNLWLMAGGPRVNAFGYCTVLVLALVLPSWSGFQYAEWKLYDQSLKLLRAIDRQPVVNDVVIIAADEDSFTAFDEPFALWHGRIGALIDAMAVAQPAVIGMDMVLPAKSFDAVIPGIDHRLLVPLLRARGKLKLVVVQTLDDNMQPRAIFPGFVSLIGAQNLATAVLCFDEDSVVRRVMPGRCGDSLPPDGPAPEPKGLAQRMAALLDAPLRGHGLIDFRRGGDFNTVSMAQVLRWQAEGNVQALRDTFGGKPVLLGVVLPLEDRLRVPVALLAAEPGNARVPGVLVHAQILRSILNHGYIQPAPRALVWALTALLCLSWFGFGFKKNLGYWALFALLPALGLYALWLGYAIAPAALLLATQVAYGARQGLESMRMAHQRKRLTQAFAGHINPRLLQRVLASNPDHDSSELAARRQQATVMWVQIPQPDSTKTDAPAESALRALSSRFDGVQRAVQRSGGMVDRFQGTGALAYFGAPLPLRHHARAALEAALDICRANAASNAALAQAGSAPMPLRIGIATGSVVAGQAPMKQARPFVVVGDPVQQAFDLAATTTGIPADAPGSARVFASAPTAQAVGYTRLQAVDAGHPSTYELDLR